jgi:NitT/TauT family transport system substrate-binding protein
MQSKSKMALGVLVLLLAGLSLYCAVNRTRPIRIGYLPIYVDLPLFVAQDQGFFQKRGVSVELVRFATSPAIGTALVTNDVQFGASIAYSVVLSTESRDPGILKVFVVDSETPENYLSSFVVLPTSGIKTIQDLKGKRVASFPGPTAVTFGKMVLEKAGLDPARDLQFFELDSALHLDALTSHSVDALFTYEPIATQAVLERGAVKLLPGAVESQIINPWQAGVWAVSEKFATSRSTDARSVMLAIYDAIDFYRSHPETAKAALEKYTSIRSNVALATPNIPFAKLGEIDLRAFQKHADILQQRGIISKHIDAKALLAPVDWIR